MAASRKKAPTVGSSQWTLDERQQSNDLIMQELEDFSFSVRNELEWLNEHMNEIFAQDGQNNLDVFKTPGKLRGKTPRTARKKAAEPRQPLGDIFSTNVQKKQSPAQQSLAKALQKHAPIAKFQIAEDIENIDPATSTPVKSPVPRPLFSKQLGKGKENRDSPLHATTREEDIPISRFGQTASTIPVQWSPKHSTQDTVPDTQEDTQIFSQSQTQSTQPTQHTQSFGVSLNTSDGERRDTGESFVSAKEALGSNRASKENLDDHLNADMMDVDSAKPDNAPSDAQVTTIHFEASSSHENAVAIHHEPSSPQQPRVLSGVHGISAETQEAHDNPNHGAHDTEPKNLIGMAASTNSADPALNHDDTVVHHDIDDMDIDDDVRSPSDNSSPVKPVRKSSLSFAPLPSREPLLAKKSMGNRVSRTSHVDQNKARNSQFGRYTSGKSLGGSQYTQMTVTHDDVMDLDHDRPGVQREESETTRLHNSTSTKSLKERLNMLNHRNEPPKRISQTVVAPQPSQPHTSSFSQPQLSHSSQPAYPSLPSGEPEKENEDEDDDWISPVRTVAPAPSAARPILSKSYSADTRPATSSEAIVPKPISVSNPQLSTVVESTTPVGSPTGKKYVDGPISASRAKLYSAFRVAKEKIIGSSASSAQAKLDALAEGPMRPQLQATSSSEDIFSPKRNEKNGNSFFSHLRSPSKESVKSTKTVTKVAAMPGSPIKDDGRRTRSSSERERQKEKETKQKNRTEERLKEMRSKEQLKAAAHYQKTKAAATKTPVAPPPQPNFRAAAVATKTPVNNTEGPQRPGTIRMNTGPRQQDPDCGDDMPPPPPPKSLLPTGAGHKLREPKRLAKAPSKDTLPKGKPQKIQVNLHRDRFGQAPATSKPAPPPSSTRMAPPPVPKPAPQAPRAAPISNSRPAPPSKVAPTASKPALRVGRPGQPIKMQPKPAPASTQPRSDLAAARSVSRMQTVEDASRIKVYPVNPAKSPPKRAFQPDTDEPPHPPAKRPSQQARSKPVTPAHAQFAQGKIPFAEPPPTIQYPPSEDIKLPDIMTDSEDEDSDNDFEQPSWVNTPNLREMLTNQQLVDPEQIFGPIAPLNMEQVFPNKERHKRFRDRTSSAYWANDQVTEEERRKEREARERLVRDGAWTYNPSPAPDRRA